MAHDIVSWSKGRGDGEFVCWNRGFLVLCCCPDSGRVLSFVLDFEPDSSEMNMSVQQLRAGGI